VKRDNSLYRDLERLTAASIMLAVQQWERVVFGDDDEYQDVKSETRQVVSEVLPNIERVLDEDMVKSLDNDEYERLLSAWGFGPLLQFWRTSAAVSCRSYRTLASLVPEFGSGRTLFDEIIEDFRLTFEARLRRARREDRELGDDEIDEVLKDLKADLKVVANKRPVEKSGRKGDEPKEAGRLAAES
jgi:hypothetical protein